jgi:hypothetical protein
MAIDTTAPGSPGWWMSQLSMRLEQRRRGAHWTRTSRNRRERPGLDLLDDYLRGDPPLPHVAAGWSEAMLPLLRESRMNYAELVVEAPRERMIPLGWTTAVDADESGDEVAARVAAANELELRSADVFRWMLALGDGYMMVGPPDPETGVPVISAEDPRQVITADDAATGRVRAALKTFRDEWTGDQLAYLYLPGEVWVARQPGTPLAAGSFYGDPWNWDPNLSRAMPSGFDDMVPVVRFRNVDGQGEYERHLDVLDRINSEIFRRVSIAANQAYRQRAIKGLKETTDDLPAAEDGSNVIDYTDVFTADPGALWQVPADVDFWESQPIDLGPIRSAVKDDVEALAAVTRTPLHYITPDAAQGSAEGASVMRESLVYRVEDRRRRASASFARVMSMAFRMMGEAERADVLSIRTLWQPAERYSLQERANAAALLNMVLPRAVIQRDVLQYTPDQIPQLQRAGADDLQRQAEEAALLTQAGTPPRQPTPPQTPQRPGQPAQPGQQPPQPQRRNQPPAAAKPVA